MMRRFEGRSGVREFVIVVRIWHLRTSRARFNCRQTHYCPYRNNPKGRIGYVIERTDVIIMPDGLSIDSTPRFPDISPSLGELSPAPKRTQTDSSR